MAAHIEVGRPSGLERVTLEDERVTLGRDDTNQICLIDDDAVSGMHAVLERYSSGWALRDLGSRNGTFVNGERVTGERPLHNHDQIQIGSTRSHPEGAGRADRPVPPPVVIGSVQAASIDPRDRQGAGCHRCGGQAAPAPSVREVLAMPWSLASRRRVQSPFGRPGPGSPSSRGDHRGNLWRESQINGQPSEE
jgi:predicted component of type VI protein secretion system